jgi:hypothetical protein
MKFHLFRGMSAFWLIWLGQMVSMSGSELTSFALGIWVYQKHQIVTEFALISLARLLPELLLSPFAGVLVDRWSRQKVMILSDTGSALSTLGIVLLLVTGRLEVWHIYLATAISAAFGCFQLPAYAAATTMLVPPQSLGKANGLIHLGEAVSQLLSPLLAGVLIGIIHLQGVITLDFITFFLAILSLMLVQIPQPNSGDKHQSQSLDFFREILEGWHYITARVGLLRLLVFVATNHFLVGFVSVLVTPLVLSFTTPAMLGFIMFIGGVGMVAGGLCMTSWGSRYRYIDGVLIFSFLSGLSIFCAGLRTSIPLISLCAFLFFFSFPLINSCNQVIWQKKVPPAIQGRVFAIQRTFLALILPFAYVVSGILADRVFEPFMSSPSWLAQNIGLIIGTGPGRGIGLLFIIFGIFTIVVSSLAYLTPFVRNMETDLPDQI